MSAHTFACSDTPGLFECPACPATAHYEREERRYCIHPADQDAPAYLVDGWSDVRGGTHADQPHHWTAILPT